MERKIYLAPMSGVTDLAFRLISRKLGASHCFFEMLDAKSMLYNSSKSKRLLKTLKKDAPLAAQLVGADPSVMLDAAEQLLNFVDISFLDINSACPAKKITHKGAGAALLKNTVMLGKIIKKLSSKLQIPVTVKLRTGFNKKDVTEAVRIAKICQANGASIVFMHGRTKSQGYSGDIDYESIKAVKTALKIPVFGSGNILNPLMAKKMFEETGCDGILVARGALGNPWIFKNIENHLKNGRPAKTPSLPKKKKILKKHLAYIKKYKDLPDINKIGFMRKVTMWYLKGIFNAASVRGQICRAGSYKELINLINRAGGFL
ncbi:MAG: tRNA dihydrouridine synthase DusB [Candidatus Omnitrophota bacterium]|nr:tRNA dihydrouridine synthase DusB [Candidatus Omnitrophota bacterium]